MGPATDVFVELLQINAHVLQRCIIKVISPGVLSTVNANYVFVKVGEIDTHKWYYILTNVYF